MKKEFIIKAFDGKKVVVKKEQKAVWDKLRKNKDLEESIRLLSLE